MRSAASCRMRSNHANAASRHHRATLARPARPVRPAPPRRPSPKPRPCCAAPTAPSIIRPRKTCAATAAITAAPRTSDCRRPSVDGAPAGIVGRVARHVLALAANDERRARVIAVVLLAYLSFDSHGLRGSGPFLYVEICGAYLALAIVFVLTAAYARRSFLLQLLTQIACDLTVISLLYLGAGGVRSGLAILYLFPLAGSAILAPLLPALACAAVVTLFMLAESTYQVFVGDGEMVLQSGLYCAAFFGAVLVVNRLAARRIGQEELAVQRGVEISVQQAVNRLVMANVGDGIVVIGADGQVYAGNPAAQQMLGLIGPDLRFKL